MEAEMGYPVPYIFPLSMWMMKMLLRWYKKSCWS